MPDKKIPMCWKCSSKITEQVDNSKPIFVDSLTVIGCKECKEIKNYSDAEKMCP